MTKQYRKVQPCGMLYSQGREYFLLKPEPLPGDSWERDNAYRFVVVPRVIVAVTSNLENRFSFARHIVTTAFVVDYSPNMPEIMIEDLGELDVSRLEEPEEVEPPEFFFLRDEEDYLEHLLDNVDQYNGEGLA